MSDTADLPPEREATLRATMRYLALEQKALDELKQAAIDEARSPSGPADMGAVIRMTDANDRLQQVHALARAINLPLRWHGSGYPETDKQRKAMEALEGTTTSPDAELHWNDAAQVAAGRLIRAHMMEALAEIKEAMGFRLYGGPYTPRQRPLPHDHHARKIAAAAIAGDGVEIDIGELAAIASESIANLSWGMITKLDAGISINRSNASEEGNNDDG